MTDVVEKDIKISPKFRSSKWKALDFDSGNNQAWEDAVDIFYDRINGRFLAPVKTIENHPDRDIRGFCGFVILAIDCLLIETLYQFYNGVDETDRDHMTAFWHFFRGSRHFKTHFTKKMSGKFYTHFRCGILHQAQTKMLSEVRIDQTEMVRQVNQEDLEQGLIIDRKKFHQALCDEISDYKDKLINPKTQKDFELRNKFRDKMSFIAK